MTIIREYKQEDVPAIAEFQKGLNRLHFKLDSFYYKPSTFASKEFSDYLLKRKPLNTPLLISSTMARKIHTRAKRHHGIRSHCNGAKALKELRK